MSKPYYASAPIDVGSGYQVEFSLRGSTLKVEWSPDVPDAAGWRQIYQRYAVARDLFIAARCARFAGTINLKDVR